MFSFIIQTITMLYLYPDVSSQFMPGSFPMAPQMPMRMPMPAVPAPMPHMMPMPMQNPAVPYPMAPQQKLPVVVMPFYSKAADKKKEPKKKRSSRKKKKRSRQKYRSSSSSSETSSSCESSSSESSGETYRSSRRSKLKPRRQVLTPVVSYVTKDGYVIYQKKIRKDKARDLLQLGDKDRVRVKSNEIVDSDDDGHVHVKRRGRSSRHKH